MKIRIASRQSPLALLQVGEALESIAPFLPEGVEIERHSSSTIGDKDLVTPLTDASIPADFFTRELDQALLAGEIDLVIHSAKDLPEEIPDGITLACLLPARDVRDALVLRPGLEGEPSVFGTSSPRREAYILEHFPGATIKPIRGSIQQRIEQTDAGDYDAVIIAACALDRLDLSDRIHSYFDYEPTPNQGRLAITVRSGDKDLLRRLQRADVRRTAGMVALIGCPADLTLLSRRAVNYLESADLILHDRLIPPGVLRGLEDKCVSVGKTGGKPSISQAEIHRQVLHGAESGKLVVRLHGGDPGILGHLGETLEFLADWQLRCDVIPAVTAAQMAGAKARAALTHRHGGRSITYRSGHGYQDGLPGPDQGHQAIYMGVGERERIVRELIQAGWPGETSVVVGEQIGWPTEAVVYTSLAKLPEIEIGSPAVILVGPEGFPSLGYTLFTGTDPELFLPHGPLIHLPFIQLKAVDLAERCRFLEAGLADFEGIVFPSRIAVRCVVEALFQFGDARLLAGKKLLAVGPATAQELATVGLKADAAPNNFGGATALAGELGDAYTGRYLYPCSSAAPVETRIAAMQAAGIELVPQVFYDNESIQQERLPRLPFPRVLFTSGSTVRAYFEQFPEEREAGRRWIAVGTSTLKVLEELGLPGEVL